MTLLKQIKIDSGTGAVGGVRGTVYCEKFIMIDLTTDAKNNIKKPIIPLSPCIMYMYKYTVWAIPTNTKL